MSDEDVIQKMAVIWYKVTGKLPPVDNGRVSIDEQVAKGKKEVYTIEFYGNNARAIMRLIVRHMSYRRRQRIWQVLNGYKYTQQTFDKSNIVQLCLRTK